MALTWTAPGNDGSVGEATGYDLRYSTSPINAGNFSSATQVANVPVPASGRRGRVLHRHRPDARHDLLLRDQGL